MVTRMKRQGFTLVELLVVIAIIGILVALLLPAIQAAREAARRNGCINNMKQIGTAVHNHHDVKKRMPLASTQPMTAAPGNATDSGYSWITFILPFMEETQLYDQLSRTSGKFNNPAFHADNVALGQQTGGYHASTNKLGQLICPSYAGIGEVDSSTYDTDPAVVGYAPTGADPPLPPAISNYMGFVTSHIVSGAIPADQVSGSLAGNGAMPMPTADGVLTARGLAFKALRDGTSKTVIATESKEPYYASWLDGQAVWVVGAWPDGTPPIEAGQTGGPTDLFLGWPESAVISGDPLIALNKGEDDNDPNTDEPYMATIPGGSTERGWGPSSDHTGDLTIVLYGDAHVSSLSVETVDPNVYLRLITRAGGEPIPADLE